MSSSYGDHAASGPSPGGQASFHPGAYSNISPLSPLRKTTQVPSQLMGSSHSKSSNPGPSSSFKAAVSGGIGFKRVFASKKKKSLDLSAMSAEHDLPQAVDTSSETLNIILKNSVVQHTSEPSSPSPPPLPPKHSSYPLPTVVQSKSLNRASILPISPGISPAVNYMLQQQQTDATGTPTSQPQQPHPQPQPQQSAPALKETEKNKLQNTPDNVEMKESWRKSDSTNSHTTVRPGENGGSARTSRPVSVAESFQSTHTVVQASNKRLSALIIDGMPEEDGESFISVDDNSSSLLSRFIPPPSSDKVKNRRSMSLNLGPPTNNKIPIPAPLASASVMELKHSLSPPPTVLNISPAQSPSPTRLSLAPPPSTSVDTGIGQQQPRTSGVNNFRGKFAAWANSNLSSDNLSRQDRSLLAMPPQQQRRPSLPHFAGDGGMPSPPISTPTPLRQTTTSMSGNGLGPVKRAVEKMGWKWGMSLSPSTSGSGSGYSSSSSSTNAPSSRTSDYGLVRTNSNRSTPSVHSHIVKSSHSQGSAVGLAGVVGGKTPDAPSGRYSIHSVTSKSDNDPFGSSLGASLGTMLRGGLRNENGVVSSGVVFGKALKTVTRETGVNVGKDMRSVSVPGGRVKEGLVLELERRLLPAIVVRCAQHLLIWGVQEEGLFRVNGRPSHVSKLRSEFDSGVDYDMTECSPGDLDPHAVASVFKAYLRELPESILTHTFAPLFDAAIKKEASTHLNSLEASRSSGVGRGKPRLPQEPKNGFAVRKPPSLSTLSMPTFSGIPPPSTSLVAEIKLLLSKLPQENYDLLCTVVDLIKATGKESTKTKMPLSNLMLVFCPSLNMTPPLLKLFCEAEGIWAEVVDSPEPPPLPLKDGQFFKREEEADVTDSSEEMEDDEEDEVEEKSFMSSGRVSLDTTDDPSSGYHASAEEETSLFDEGQITRRRHLPERKTERSEIPTIYLDTMSHYSSSSGSSLREPLAPSGGHHHHHMNSKDTDDDDGSISPASGLVHLVPPVLSPSTPLCSSSAESVAHPISESSASLQLQEGEGKIDGVGPIEIVDPDLIPMSLTPMTAPPTRNTIIGHLSSTNDDNALQFPQLLSTPSLLQKRMSITLRSLPNLSPSFIASSGDADRLRDDDSLCPSPTSPTGIHMLNKRSKRPSLRLLFSKSKKSGSSLNSLGDRSGNGIIAISNPLQQHLPRSPAWDSGTSDSSGSTPLSAVTAASGTSSPSHLPPVLDTPIDGSSLSFDMGFGSPPDTAIPNRGMREQQKLAKVDVDVTSPAPTVIPAIPSMSGNTRLEEVLQTPIASRPSIVPKALPSLVTMIPAISYPSLDESPGSSPLSVPKRPSSSAHSPQLSLIDDGGEEDWTQSVLSAADKL